MNFAQHRHHGDGYKCTKCGCTVYISKRETPPGLCDMCSVAYDFRGCTTCKGNGAVLLPDAREFSACPTCMAPAGPGEDRCEAIGSSLWADKRCVLRRGHWGYCGRCAVNGHVFGDLDEDTSARYMAAHRSDPKAYP
jgi:hypothetical protein